MVLKKMLNIRNSIQNYFMQSYSRDRIEFFHMSTAPVFGLLLRAHSLPRLLAITYIRPRVRNILFQDVHEGGSHSRTAMVKTPISRKYFK